MKMDYPPSVPALIKYGHHIIFFTGIALMASLIIWWAIFISTSIDQQHDLKLEVLKKTLIYKAETLENKFLENQRIEKISSSGTAPEELADGTAVQLKEGGILRIKPDLIKKIKEDMRKKKFMLTGESIFLFALLLICCTLLYRFINLGKKLSQDTENFWRSITHEIKTPITGIKIFLQSLQKGSIKEKDIQNYLSLAMEQVNNQEKIAENLIAGAFLGSKNDFFPTEEFELKEFIVKYMEFHPLKLSDASLINDLPREKINIKSSPDALRLILNNLLDNSCRYCFEKPLQITISLKLDSDELKLIVEDNGPGLSPEALENFKNRIRSNQKGSGAGIGLQVSVQLANRIGGKLELENKVTGAKFVLTLKR